LLRRAIRNTFLEKLGLQSPIVHWLLLTEARLEGTLLCNPPARLNLWFMRFVHESARSLDGLSDLIRSGARDDAMNWSRSRDQ
jgi:hypothetical protein